VEIQGNLIVFKHLIIKELLMIENKKHILLYGILGNR